MGWWLELGRGWCKRSHGLRDDWCTNSIFTWNMYCLSCINISKDAQIGVEFKDCTVFDWLISLGWLGCGGCPGLPCYLLIYVHRMPGVRWIPMTALLLIDLWAQDARSAVDPKDCALIIGITYFISAILSLILKEQLLPLCSFLEAGSQLGFICFL